jgi:hypothetical protein
MNRDSRRSYAWLALAVALAIPSTTRADLLSTDDFRLFADFRARLEADWDSQNSSGAARDDRNRLRIRTRIGAQYDPNEHLSFGVRLRTGSDDSQQSPHITLLDFDDNPTGDAHVNLDKWYLQGKCRKFWGWVGRNGLPFWKQNELYWDDDVTPAGLAGGFKTAVGEDGSIAFNAAVVSLPAGMRDFVGQMTAGQLVYDREIGNGGLTVAVGSLSMDGESDEGDFPGLLLLLDGNGSRDYEIRVGSLQGRLRAGERPLTLGADVIHNAEAASDADGHVLSLLYGGGKEKGDWLIGWYYAEIEALAVHSSYAQDDWVRWGNATQTRGSNMEGHELRFVYNVDRRTNVVARLYLVEAVTGVEDGNRFRIDLNRKL